MSIAFLNDNIYAKENKYCKNKNVEINKVIENNIIKQVYLRKPSYYNNNKPEDYRKILMGTYIDIPDLINFTIMQDNKNKKREYCSIDLSVNEMKELILKLWDYCIDIETNKRRYNR